MSSPLKILVADPVPANLTFYRELLADLDISCITTTESDTVEQLVISKEVDLVLIDSGLKEPDGYQLINNMSANDQLRRVPVIFTVGNLSEQRLALHAELMKYIEVIAKPLDRYQLMDVLEQYKHQHQLRTLIDSLAGKDEAEQVDSVDEGILGVNADGQIIYANYAAERILKASIRQLNGIYLESLFEDPCTRVQSNWQQHPIYKVTLSDQILQVERSGLWRLDGESIQVKFVAAPFHSDTGINLLFAFRQLKESREAKDKIARLSQTDRLTGLPLRSAIEEQVDRLLMKASLAGYYFAILYIDLDHFRYVNESMGHDLGDQLIKQISERIEQLVRRDDVIGRMEGDEFVVILSHIDTPENAGLVARKIIDSLRAPFLLDGHEVFIGCSIGVSVYPSCGDSSSVLVKNAESALAQAKQIGCNSLQYFNNEMNRFRVDEMSFVYELHQAVEKQLWRIQYSPVIEPAGQDIVACEVKLFWQHPKKGELPLDQFLSVAENTGLAPNIFAWLWQQALTHIQQLTQDLSALTVIMPLSVSTLVREGGVDWINHQVADAGLAPEQVYLEFPEGHMSNRDGVLSQLLNDCFRSGYPLVLDSFGSGYAPFNLLKEVPYTMVKISEPSVAVCEMSKMDQALIRASVNLAHELGIRVLATTIDSDKQLQLLQTMGCDWLSGDQVLRDLQQTPYSPENMSLFLRSGQ